MGLLGDDGTPTPRALDRGDPNYDSQDDYEEQCGEYEEIESEDASHASCTLPCGEGAVQHVCAKGICLLLSWAFVLGTCTSGKTQTQEKC